jgi:uncharacterized protein YpmS
VPIPLALVVDNGISELQGADITHGLLMVPTQDISQYMGAQYQVSNQIANI